MPGLSSVDDYIVAQKQLIPMFKAALAWNTSSYLASTIQFNGQPGAGVLAGTSTAAGVVPTDATDGFPTINAFPASGLGYITRVIHNGAVTQAVWRYALYDVLFKAGAYAFNSNVTLASQPSFSSRVPGGDYKGLELWFETVTAFTGTPSVNVGYTDQDGNTGATTGVQSIGGAFTINRMYQFALAAGDYGIQKVESVVASVASAGTFNILVMRKLWQGFMHAPNAGGIDDIFLSGMPQVYEDSALGIFIAGGGAVAASVEMTVEIASK